MTAHAAHATDGPASGPLPADLVDRRGFFADEELISLQSRALAYLEAGLPVHLRGPAGIGKTTLALHLANVRARPVALLTGDKWVTRAELVGRAIGHVSRAVDDTYINRVRRTESQMRADWRDGVLTRAMRGGWTLVYDEFTRSTPEANATLLSVLEEGVLVVLDPACEASQVSAHPDFRVILTSNPHDYVGVQTAPDALLDRMITFDMDAVSAESEAGMVASRTGLGPDPAGRIVQLVRNLRSRPEFAVPPSIRAALMIARLVQSQAVPVDSEDPRFLQICVDVLRSRQAPTPPAGVEGLVRELMAAELTPIPDTAAGGRP